ncbi:hypothetical protein ACFQ1I_46530 [Kitasatospora arboriphila]
MAIEGADRVALDLRNAKVEGLVRVWGDEFWQRMFIRPDSEQPKVWLDGFTYSAPPETPGPDTWLRVLRQCMPQYAPQPYQQLAKVYRDAGDEPRAKTALIAQQDAFGEALSQDDARRLGARAWHSVTRVTVLYGYRPTRALWFLLAVLVASCALMLIADTQGWLVHPKARDDNRGHCGVVESTGTALDRTVPLLGFTVVAAVN